jgi:TonB family protein
MKAPLPPAHPIHHHAPRQPAHPPRAMPTPAPVTAPAHDPAPAAPAAAVATPVENASADALYSGLVHATIEGHKRNPDSPAYRMLHPHGTVMVSFTVTRAGISGSPHVRDGSGSGMLDAQAALIVAGCRFPPMPPQAFAGAKAHLFEVEITFPPFGGAD